MDRIDKDNDGKITQKELEDWIKFTSKRYVFEDVDRQWEQLKKIENSHMTLEERYVDKKEVDPNGPIGWELYKNMTYGYIPGKFNPLPLNSQDLVVNSLLHVLHISL